jgi:Zn-dependent peptidase ImmA (M78 family)/transcriptional regulator with XRE-family HTH domain
MFNPSRLEFARKRRGLSKKELASKVGLSSRSISLFENKEMAPSEETLRKIASVIHFPFNFFFGEDIDTPHQESVSFRALSKMSAAKMNSALCSGGIALLFNNWVDQKFRLPEPNLMDFPEGQDPEVAAAVLRQAWGLGELSIKNVIHLLESKGIRVFSLAENTKSVDAYSLWKNNIPFVFLNTLKSAERSKFDAAHELGHLVLHKHGAPTGHDAEKDADQFASAFLMPRSSVLAHASQLTTLSSLIKLKKKWGVSLAALAYRMHKLGALSDWHYRSLCIEMSQKGFHKSEPEGIERERSKIWEMVFSNLRSEGITKNDIAKDLGVYADEIESLVFDLVLMNVIQGGNSSQNTNKTKIANLRLVK